MELEDDTSIGDQSDLVLCTQAVRVVDHLLSLLCCGRGHSSLTSIKSLGDRLLHQGYLPKTKWEKKHPITKDKIILLNWIKEHISPKDFQVKDALFQCVHDLKLLEGGNYFIASLYLLNIIDLNGIWSCFSKKWTVIQTYVSLFR